MRVRKADLGRLEKISSGGFGVVYRVPDHRLPGDPDELAYKEFTRDVSEQARGAQVTVDLWHRLDPAGRAELGSLAAWPRALVEDGGAVCGLLMPLIPRAFFFKVRDPKSKTGAKIERPRSFEWLISTADQRRLNEAELPDIDRVDREVLLAKLIYAIGKLHKWGWVYGDVSVNNVVFALDPPRIRLIDCDAAAPLSDGGRRQGHTPHWAPPEYMTGSQRLQDERSDVYKLALAVVRCLTPGAGVATTSSPRRLAGAFDDAGIRLIEAALHPDRDVRPTAKDLYAHLCQRLQGRTSMPVVHNAAVVQPFLLRGQDVRLQWNIVGATEIVIEAPNGQTIDADPKVTPTGIAFRPEASGPIAIVARNKFGTVRVELEDITLYELPRFEIGDVTLPPAVIPSLSAVALQAPAAVLDRRPVVGVGVAAIAPPAPDVSALMAGIAPVARPLPPLPRLDRAIGDAANAVLAAVVDRATKTAHEAAKVTASP